MRLLLLLSAYAAADPPAGGECGYCGLVTEAAVCSGPGLAENTHGAPVAAGSGYGRLTVSAATAVAGGMRLHLSVLWLWLMRSTAELRLKLHLYTARR